MVASCKEQVGDTQHTRHYVAPYRYGDDPSEGVVPARYHMVTTAGIQCYSNVKQPEGTSLYLDGSLQAVEPAGAEYQAAGASVTKGYPAPGSGPTTVVQGQNVRGGDRYNSGVQWGQAMY